MRFSAERGDKTLSDRIKKADRKKNEVRRGKFYYADGQSFLRNNNPVPPEYENKIICADCLEVLKKLPDNCIDIIFTSPPYNFGLDYDVNNDTENWEEYFKKLFMIFEECIRVLKHGGRFIINIQPLYSDGIPTHHIISKYFMEQKMMWKGEMLWEKNHHNCRVSFFGSWKSPSSPYLKYTWEFLEVYCKGSIKKAGNSADADITADEFKTWVNAKWTILPETRMKEYGHPAMFPEHLAERILKLFSYKGDIVLDPFNGAGTTTAVAKKINRRYIGIDISAAYCDMAEKRLDENT